MRKDELELPSLGCVVRLDKITLKMKILERVMGQYLQLKRCEKQAYVVEYVETRSIDFVVRRIDKIERCQTTRGRGRPKKL